MSNNTNNTNNSSTNNNSTISFEAFIVPNNLVKWETMPNYLKERLAADLRRFGIEPDEGEYAQVWILSESLGLENATDHGLDREVCETLGLDYAKRGYYAPGYLPVSLIRGLKEGDSVTTTSENGTNIVIKFEQKPYRYGRFGRFEEVLEYLS